MHLISLFNKDDTVKSLFWWLITSFGRVEKDRNKKVHHDAIYAFAISKCVRLSLSCNLYVPFFALSILLLFDFAAWCNVWFYLAVFMHATKKLPFGQTHQFLCVCWLYSGNTFCIKCILPFAFKLSFETQCYCDNWNSCHPLPFGQRTTTTKIVKSQDRNSSKL